MGEPQAVFEKKSMAHRLVASEVRLQACKLGPLGGSAGCATLDSRVLSGRMITNMAANERGENGSTERSLTRGSAVGFVMMRCVQFLRPHRGTGLGGWSLEWNPTFDSQSQQSVEAWMTTALTMRVRHPTTHTHVVRTTTDTVLRAVMTDGWARVRRGQAESQSEAT